MAAHQHAPSGSDHHAHGHDHAHGHSHGHSHGSSTSRTRLTIVLVLSATYMIAEVVGGYVANSLALLADAGHMLSDVASLVLALIAMRVAQRPPTMRRTFGYQRAEILAALVNGAALLAASVWILFEAWERMHAPADVSGAPMFAIATGGLLVNLGAMAILHGGRDAGLNERGVWLHVATDALGSVGAMIAGVAVWKFGVMWADPVVSVVIALLVAGSSWRLLRETVDVLMESAPAHVDVAAVRSSMAAVDGVGAVHDLHVWSIGSGMVALAGHVQVSADASPERQAAVLGSLCAVLRDVYHIEHSTIQLEPEGFALAARCDAKVVSAGPRGTTE